MTAPLVSPPISGPVSATGKQLRLLRFVAGYLEATGGISPTFAEMARGIGCTSKTHVRRRLIALEERGYLRRLRFRCRAIEVLAAPPIPRAPDGAPLFFVHLEGANDGRCN